MVEDRGLPPVLGKYKILQRLAIGGMAELFLARVTGLEGFEKYVVVKRILPQYAEDRHFVDMFIDEARLAARLDHQNIVQVHDIGQEESAYFFVMEYLHGEDAQELLRAENDRRSHIPLEQALTIVTGVAAGLQYAHEKRDIDGLPLHIVHRDVAPSNIIITYDGGVKLVDFGIARAHFRRSQTEAGRVKGKLSYMSPEQCRGEELDARSDIFALGIVTYELTTMSRLFRVRRSNKLEVMERIVKGDIPPPKLRVPDYPEELDTIVMRALRTSRKQRYQTAGDMLHELEAFAKNHGLSLSSQALARYLRDAVGYRPEPWRVDRAEPLPTDSGKVKREAAEAAIAGVSNVRTNIPTPGRPSQVVSGAITLEDAGARKDPFLPALPRRRRRRLLVAFGVLAVIGVAAVGLAELGSEGSSHSSTDTPGAATSDGAASAAMPAVADTPDESGTSSETTTASDDDSTHRRQRDRKSRRDKKSSSDSDAKSSDTKSSDTKSSDTKSSDTKKTVHSSDTKSSGTKKTVRSSDTKSSDTKKTDKEPKESSQPPDESALPPSSDSKSDKDSKERKKWDPNSPFPPSAGE